MSDPCHVQIFVLLRIVEPSSEKLGFRLPCAKILMKSYEFVFANHWVFHMWLRCTPRNSHRKVASLVQETPSISGFFLWFISVYPSFPWFPVIHGASPWFPVIVFFCLGRWARSGTHRILSRHCEPHRGQSGPTDRTLTVGFIYSRDLLGNITTIYGYLYGYL